MSKEKRWAVPLLMAVCSLIVTCRNPWVTKLTNPLFEEKENLPTVPDNPVIPWDGYSVDYTWYTSGTSPYYINTAAELAGFAKIVNGTWGGSPSRDNFSGKDVILTNNINLGSHDWTPIGTASYTFDGTFDGNGHTVSNLTINAPSSMYQGFIGVVGAAPAQVMNIGINSGSVIGGTFTGGLVGRNWGGAVENCYVTCSVTSTSSLVGGVVGHNYGIVLNCYATGSVTGSGNVGGVVGGSESGTTVGNCYATGIIIDTSGTSYSGGVVGDSYGVVQDCVALNPSITGSWYYGRVIGSMNGPRANNRARDDMSVLPYPPSPSTCILTDMDGLGVTVGSAYSSFFTGGNWGNSGVWNMPSGTLDANGQLPTLVAVPQSPAPRLP